VSPSSLERFETVSRHPLISKSVKTVSFRLEVFKYQYATSLFRFAQFAVNLAERELGISLDSPAEEDRIPTNVREKWDVDDLSAKEVKTMRSICESWHRLSWNPHTVDTSGEESGDYESVCSDGEKIRGEVSDEDRPHWDFLREQYGEYKRLYEEQGDLIEKQGFFRRVAEAVARMPRANGLQFRDLDIRKKLKTRFPGSDLAYDNKKHPNAHLRRAKFLLQQEPFLRSFNESYDPGSLGSFILDLTEELAKVGKLPTSVEIKLFDGRDAGWTFPYHSREFRGRLESTMQQLVSFRFRSECPLTRWDSIEGSGTLRCLLHRFSTAPFFKRFICTTTTGKITAECSTASQPTSTLAWL
jgi:hypothetical protein